MRYNVDPRDAPAGMAARRLGLTAGTFRDKTPELYARGFLRPDETTGLYDLDAVDEWRRQLFVSATEQARDSRVVARNRLEGDA